MTKKKNENDEVYTRYKNIVNFFAGNSNNGDIPIGLDWLQSETLICLKKKMMFFINFHLW